MMRLTCWTLEVVEPGIGIVRFSRPPVNAQNQQSRVELIDLMEAISERDDILVVILTGDGRTFSAGADIKERHGIGSGDGEYLRHNRITREFFDAVPDCTKPVIGALNGPAIGAGYALAAGCDILVAAESAYIQMPELDRGLMGGAKFLEQHLPRSIARMLFFTGDRLDAERMLQYGMVVDVVPGDELVPAALGLARQIARKHPKAVAKAKTAFNVSELLPHRDGYRYEQTLTYELSTSAYAHEAQAAFLEKRPPRFGSDRTAGDEP